MMDSSEETIPTVTQTPASPTQDAVDDKYKKLKRKLREIIELNTILNRDYSRARKKIKSLKVERNILLDNISRAEEATSDESDSDLNSNGSDSDSDVDIMSSKFTRPITPIKHHQQQQQQQQQQSTRDVATVASAPPKRSKITRITVKTRRVQPIDRDSDGNPKLPQQIGVLTVLNLGHIVNDRDTFHNERYIFPVGYAVSRTYPSMVDPTSNTVITSTILDGGDGPRFHIVAADMPDEPIIANSATGAWTVVVRRSNEIRHREHSNSASGPDYYGFKHPTIAKLIQDLAGADQLKNYVWQNFEEMEPRAAKGVMAAAEKKRGNLEQMGNANRKVPKVPTNEGGGEELEEEQSSNTELI